MLSLFGPRQRYCDGLSRRSFLQLGGLAVGGLSMVDLLRGESAAGSRSHKSVIMVYLTGGLAHQDSFDLKPNAPAEVRGEFKPTATNVPGIDICELLPKTAAIMDKLALVRSIVGLRDEHSSFQNLTGHLMNEAPPRRLAKFRLGRFAVARLGGWGRAALCGSVSHHAAPAL